MTAWIFVESKTRHHYSPTKWGGQGNHILRKLRIEFSFFSISSPLKCYQMHSIADLSDNLELDKVHFHFFCPSSHIKMMPHKLRVTSCNSPQIAVWWCPIHHWLIWPKIANIPFLAPSHIKMMQCTITHMIDRCYSTSFCRPLWLFSRHFISMWKIF